MLVGCFGFRILGFLGVLFGFSASGTLFLDVSCLRLKFLGYSEVLKSFQKGIKSKSL